MQRELSHKTFLSLLCILNDTINTQYSTLYLHKSAARKQLDTWKIFLVSKSVNLVLLNIFPSMICLKIIRKVSSRPVEFDLALPASCSLYVCLSSRTPYFIYDPWNPHSCMLCFVFSLNLRILSTISFTLSIILVIISIILLSIFYLPWFSPWFFFLFFPFLTSIEKLPILVLIFGTRL